MNHSFIRWTSFVSLPSPPSLLSHQLLDEHFSSFSGPCPPKSETFIATLVINASATHQIDQHQRAVLLSRRPPEVKWGKKKSERKVADAITTKIINESQIKSTDGTITSEWANASCITSTPGDTQVHIASSDINQMLCSAISPRIEHSSFTSAALLASRHVFQSLVWLLRLGSRLNFKEKTTQHNKYV